jgi:hypothetical protein
VSDARKLLVDAAAADIGAGAISHMISHGMDEEKGLAFIHALTPQPDGTAVEVRNLAGSPCAEHTHLLVAAGDAELQAVFDERDAARAEIERLRDALRGLDWAGRNALDELWEDGICDARAEMIAALAVAKEVLK